MNARTIFTLLALFSLLLSACATAAQPPVQEVAEERPAAQEAPVEQPAILEMQKEVEKVIAEEPKPAQPLGEAQKPLPTQPMVNTEGNTFQHYGVNPFTETSEDHLSTFSLDVDTASYSVMRRYIQGGSLPPPESVRVEEFVNYFDQGYPTPPDVAFGIYADGAASPFYKDGSIILRLGVQGYEIAEWQRKPTSLTFVIDTSGSMGMENRLELVKRSLEMLVERLRPDDMVSIVEYGTQSRTVLSPTRGSDSGTILSAIYSLQPGGSTNAYAGLKQGYKMAMQAYISNGVNRVILCSDGVANVGTTDPQAILDEVRGYVDEGIYLTSIGVGMGNFNDVFLEQLADKGNGNYAYIDDLDEAQKQFVDNLVSNLEVIAVDAKVQVDFNPDVVAYYRLLGYENREVADEDFRDNTVDAGEIGAGHSATAVYAVILRPGIEGRIGTVQLRWQDPDTYQVKEINGNFNTWDLEASFYDADPHYQLTVLVAQFAETLRHSPWAVDTDLSQLHSMAYELQDSLPEDADMIEFINLLGQARQMTR